MKGRPTKVGFSGLFLPSIEWEMKLDEIPWRELEDCPKLGTLMRNARRQDTIPNVVKMKAAFRNLCFGDEFASVQSHSLLRALDGDETALLQVEKMGFWSWFTLGQTEPFSAFSKTYVALEPACALANALLASGQFVDAASEVKKSAEISIYWRHGSLDSLARAQSVEQTLAPRLKAWLELQMSILAKVSLTNEIAVESESRCGPFMKMLTGSPAKPGKTMMQHIQQFAGLGSLAKLKDATSNFCAERQFPSDATFNRWCSGGIFPSHKRLEPFLHAVAQLNSAKCQGKPGGQLLFAQFYVARRFTAVLGMAELWCRAGTGAVEQHLGASSPSHWAVESFDHWQRHWREMLTSDGQG